MNNYRTGMLLLLLSATVSSCQKQDVKSKLMINEVMTDNETNVCDDYGARSGWIEIYNTSYSSADLAGCVLKMSSTPGDTLIYRIPKGDVLTQIKPRQHTIFWTDGLPNRGTFHTGFTLSKEHTNWIAFFDTGENLLDQITIPAQTLKPDQSYARIEDGSQTWEVKDESADKYVTPSSHNKIVDTNYKMHKFAQHDPKGYAMAITAMGVVFLGLILLYFCFRCTGKMATRWNKCKNDEASHRVSAKDMQVSENEDIPGEIIAAISMALHEEASAKHDTEETVLTISRVKRSYSPWSSKIYTLRELPHK